MNQGKYIFSQLTDFLPKIKFDWLVKKYEGNKYVKKFTCWNHLLVMIFAQLTQRESLRDLVSTLNAHKSKFNRLGFGAAVTRSNLSKANEQREARIFEEMAGYLAQEAREYRIGSVSKDSFYEGPVYAFDSTTVSLSLQIFWWSRLHHDKGAVKMHTLYDVKTDIPSFFVITNGDVHDSKVMHLIPYEQGALYIFDRGYMNTAQLCLIKRIGAFFVVREKRRMTFEVIEDKHHNTPGTGVMADQTIKFTGAGTKKRYPDAIRRIVFYDTEDNRTFVFYTNNMALSAEEVALTYKYRWRVELFFKWIKQHLHVKEFYGTTENAVKIQPYCAIITYCLIAIIERRMKLDMDIYEMSRILSISLLERMPIRDLLVPEKAKENLQSVTQLSLNFF